MGNDALLNVDDAYPRQNACQTRAGKDDAGSFADKERAYVEKRIHGPIMKEPSSLHRVIHRGTSFEFLHGFFRKTHSLFSGIRTPLPKTPFQKERPPPPRNVELCMRADLPAPSCRTRQA